MQKIALISDSSCDLSLETRQAHTIHMIPTRIIYKDKEFRDGIDITPNEMYASLKEEMPTTSLPDSGDTEELINRLIKEGYTEAIIIGVSTELSGTLNSIKLTCDHFPQIKFFYFDTKTLGYPQGAIVLEAAKMLRDGLSAADIITSLTAVRARTHGFIAVDTLEFLIRGGRLSKTAGAIGTMLQLKPIITCSDEGKLYTYTKARGRKQSLSKMKEILNGYLTRSKCKVWVLSGDAYEEAKAFLEDIADLPNITSLSLEDIGPCMGIHTGPGVLGLCIYEEA